MFSIATFHHRRILHPMTIHSLQRWTAESWGIRSGLFVKWTSLTTIAFAHGTWFRHGMFLPPHLETSTDHATLPLSPLISLASRSGKGMDEMDDGVSSKIALPNSVDHLRVDAFVVSENCLDLSTISP